MKLDAVHLVGEDVYLVSIPYGTKLKHLGADLPASGQAVVSSLEGLVRVVPGRRVLTGYRHATTLGVIKPEQFVHFQRELLGDAYDEDEIDYSSLEQEFAHKAMLRDWQPVYEDTPASEEPVEAQVTEVRLDSGDPDIRSLWNAPDVVQAKRCLYELNVAVVEVQAFREECTKHNLKYELPGHGVLEFAKIAGGYVFPGRGYVQPKNNFIGTLEQCKERKRQAIEMVVAAVGIERAKLNPGPVGGIGELIKTLDEIKRGLDMVSPFEKHRAAFAGNRRKLAELIDSLVKEAA